MDSKDAEAILEYFDNVCDEENTNGRPCPVRDHRPGRPHSLSRVDGQTMESVSSDLMDDISLELLGLERAPDDVMHE